MVIERPSAPLRHLVHQYVGYYQQDVPLALHRALPSRHITLVVSLAEPIRMAELPDAGQGPGAFRVCLGGLHASPGLIRQDRTQHGIHVELEPLGARELLGMPAAALCSQVVELTELPGSWMNGLADRLATAPGWAARFALLDRVLRTAVARRPPPRPEIAWTWQRIVRAAGTEPVAGLATQVGWSRRHLTERFRAEFGLTPKQAARVLRFERACAMLQCSRQVNLAELAVRCGYHDQAHMTNEWRALAGCTPGTWIAEELPFLQYSGDTSFARLTV